MQPLKIQKRSRDESSQSIEMQKTETVSKKQKFGTSNGCMVVEVVDKPDNSTLVKNSSQGYDSLLSVAMEDKRFCEKQMAIATADKELIVLETNNKLNGFHQICLNRLDQTNADIDFLFTLQVHLDHLIQVLKTDEINHTDLSEPSTLLVLMLYKKIEFLKTALKIATNNPYKNIPKDYRNVLYISDAKDMPLFKEKNYPLALENIKILLNIQKNYFRFISINLISTAESCFSLGHMCFNQNENSLAIEYFKQGLSCFLEETKAYYRYLGRINSFLTSIKCGEKLDCDLIRFHDWVITTFNEYMNNENNSLGIRNNSGYDTEEYDSSTDSQEESL